MAVRWSRPDRPQLEGPQLNGPQLEEPQLNGPQLGEPQLNGPQLGEPQLDGPRLKRPQLKRPRFTWPRLSGPWLRRAILVAWPVGLAVAGVALYLCYLAISRTAGGHLRRRLHRAAGLGHAAR